jgi:thioredoxin 1
LEEQVATTTLTAANFHQIAGSPGLVLIDFWAGWCGPCRMFAPVYERVSARHPDVVFGKVDTEAEPGLAATFGISSIPTLMIVRDRVVLYAQPGALPEQALEDLIAQAQAVDMDAVRREIAANSQGSDSEKSTTAKSAHGPGQAARGR